MKLHSLSFALAVFASVCQSASAQSPLSEQERTLGFMPIFNGSGLEMWSQKGNWVVEDGAICRREKGGSLVFKGQPVPNDFELRFEWKISNKGNSGVYYRPGQYEYQILDNAGHSDGKNPRTSAASLYFCMPPAKDLTRPVGEWNEARIVCKGTVIQHWLNGEKAVDFDYADQRWEKEVELLRVRGGDVHSRGAFLQFQDHGDAVWYRAVRIREIPAQEQLVSENIKPAPVPEEMLEKERKFIESKRQPAQNVQK